MIIGLTGGIGTGKSTVARLLNMLGAAVFESDVAAKSAYFFPELKPKIIALLGEQAYLSDASLNRAYIAKSVYADDLLLKKLNAILHPAVRQCMQNFVVNHPNQLIVKESALLYETGLEKEVDKVIVVDAPEEIRIQRSRKRDSISELEVRQRMAKQWSQAEKKQRADFILINDEKQPLIPQVLHLYSLLTNHVP